MSSARPRLTKLLAILGALAMAVSLGVMVSAIEPTEASRADQAHGKSTISAGQPYARAISSYGTMFPLLSSTTTLGPTQALAGAAKAGTAYEQQSPGLNYSGALGAFPLEAQNRSCARAGTSSRECSSPSPQSSGASAYAVAETGQLKMWSDLFRSDRLITIGHNSRPAAARTTAECRPGVQGVPGLDRDAELILGGSFLFNGYTGGGAVIPMPGVDSISQGTWNDGRDRYDGTVSHTSTKGLNKASSQLRLHVRVSQRALFSTVYTQRWTLDIVLAHAECGTALGVPTPPARPALEGAWPSAQMMMMARSAPTALRSIVEVAEEQAAEEPAAIGGIETTDDADREAVAVGGDAELPSLDDAAAAAEELRDETTVPATATSAPATSAPATPDTATSTPLDPSPAATTAPAAEETAGPVTVPTQDPTPETTEQTDVAEDLQQPESVRIGRQFAVVNRAGVELGTARIDDIVRTPGCGVELTLSITTSAEAGPDRWSTIGPDDFAEVRSGGATRDARALSSDCAQAAASRTTALSPDHDYEITLAFLLDDSAQQAMLLPDGTAGWIFNLPPLTRVATSTPTSAAATATAPAATTATATAAESAGA